MRRRAALLALLSLLAVGCGAAGPTDGPDNGQQFAPVGTPSDVADDEDSDPSAAADDAPSADRPTPGGDDLDDDLDDDPGASPTDGSGRAIPVSGAIPATDVTLDCEIGRLLAVGTADHDSGTIFDWSNANLGPDSPGGYQDGVLGMAHWAGEGVAQLVGSFEQSGLVATPEATAALQAAADEGVALLDIGIVSPWSERNTLDVPQYDAVIDIVATSDLFREVIVYPCPAA